MKYLLSLLLLFFFVSDSSSQISYQPLYTESTFNSANIDVSLAVGSTSGVSSVASGLAGYSIPIAVPPSTNNIAAKMGFSYSSVSGNGILGQGWSISGLSVISRVGSNIYFDGQVTPVLQHIPNDNLEHDRFMLDGKRLKLILNTHYRLDHPFPEMPYYGWYSYNVDSEMSYFLIEGFGFPALNPSDPSTNNPAVFDNSKDYMFFKIEESKAIDEAAYHAKKCINVGEMNFYYSGLEDAIALVESPAYQANPDNAGDFPCPDCSWSQYQGFKFFRVEELQATEYGLPGSRTSIHVPEILLQQQFSIYGYPGTDTGGGTVIDAVDDVHEMLCDDC